MNTTFTIKNCKLQDQTCELAYCYEVKENGKLVAQEAYYIETDRDNDADNDAIYYKMKGKEVTVRKYETKLDAWDKIN